MSETIAQDCLIKGGQLIVGGDVTPLELVGFTGATGPIPGAVNIGGPLLVGTRAPFTTPTQQGTVMISRVPPQVAPTYNIPAVPIVSIQNTVGPPSPTDVLIGNMAVPVGITYFTGTQPAVGGLNQVAGATIKRTAAEGQSFITLIKSHVESFLEDIGIKNLTGVNMQNGVNTDCALVLEKSVSVNDAVSKAADQVSAVCTLNQTFKIANSKKGFDIPHPSKDGYRLRYICLEGPEAEVYLRGNLKGNTIIELPDVWRDLVDPDSIGVSLTPIGCYQELFMEKIQWGTQIVVKNNLSGPINCSYVVYGTRKDTPRNISEYEGLTTDDYPGDNREYRLNDN